MINTPRNPTSIQPSLSLSLCVYSVHSRREGIEVMGWRYGGLLVALQVIFLCSPHTAAAAGVEGVSPVLSPTVDGPCKTVTCGKGSCRVSPEYAFGYVCDCEPGWTKIHFGDHFQFLPCIIPNCTFDRSCYNSSSAPAPPVGPPPPPHRSLFDPCSWSYCGEGTCSSTSTFGHRCDCSPGYENLLNATVFPCFKECAYGADCAGLGIDVPIRPPASPITAPPSSGTAPNRAAIRFSRSLIQILLLIVPMAMIPRT